MMSDELLVSSRREVLKSVSCGFGYLALAGLATEASAAQSFLSQKSPHFQPRAKRIIFLFMSGGPSHVDTFDYKPRLWKDAGKSIPDASGKGTRTLHPSWWTFRQHGQSGQWISDLFPHVAKHADDICVINSMHTTVPNHPQAHLLMHTGEFRFVRPSIGSWLLYGLGAENQELPGFVVMDPPCKGGAQNYSSAFLPAAFQAAKLSEHGVPNLTSENPRLQKQELRLIQSMNRDLLARHQIDAQLEGVIHSFEVGFRMQESLPRVLDWSKEDKGTLKMYGDSDFGRKCLLARRLAEAGVRFIEISFPDDIWDTHKGHHEGMTKHCQATDQPIAALLTDLKQRGLLDDTLVLWGGEFGRTPGIKHKDGRDHNGTGFTMWLAGGGVKGGIQFGATDDYGIHAVEHKVHVHDLHATLLHLFGLDHQKLTYRYAGRDYSLTDIHDARVVKEILV